VTAATKDKSRFRLPGRVIAAGFGSVFAILVIGACAYLAWANRLPDLVASPGPASGSSGYLACGTALSKLVVPMGYPRAWDYTTRAPAADLRAMLKPNREALTELRAAFLLPYRNPAAHNFSAARPQLSAMRHAGRMFAAESRLACEDGRFAEAIDRALDAMDLGGRAAIGGGVLSHIMGSGCIWSAMGQAEAAVPRLTASEARAAGRRLGSIVSRLPSEAEIIEHERLLELLEARAAYQDAGSYAPPRGLAANRVAKEAWDQITVAFYPKSWSYRNLDQYYRDQVEESRRPFPLRRQVPLPADPVAAGMVVDFQAFTHSLLRSRAALCLLRLELALQEYQGLHGRYPARLDETEGLVDPAYYEDPFTARPLVYRRTAEGYRLYSLGIDLKDDGGAPVPPRTYGANARGDIVAGRLSRRWVR